MKVIRIPTEEIDFHPMSFRDDNGRLFTWKRELYRGLNHKGAALCTRMFEQGIALRLIQKGLLVETKLTDLLLDGYQLVLKHQEVPFVSYTHEWCDQMLKDAALLVIDLEMELAQHGLTVQDPNPWNLLFDGCRPIYVDFCSIASVRDLKVEWEGYAHFFRRHFLWPLLLRAHGYKRIARAVSNNFDHCILESEITALIGRWPSAPGVGKKIRSALSRLRPAVNDKLRPIADKGLSQLKSNWSRPTLVVGPTRLRFLERVRREVQGITLPGEKSRSLNNSSCLRHRTCHVTAKHKNKVVYRTLSELQPALVLDIGSDRGQYAQMAALLGARAVAIDDDETNVAQCYHDALRKNLSVLSLVMDIRYPTPGQGVGYEELPPATKRLRCDLVIALSLIHFLVFKRGLRFNQISRTLSAFSNRWLLVEFVSTQDSFIRLRRQQPDYNFPWYTLENFALALQNEFQDVNVICSNPDANVLLLCEK